MIYIPIEIQLRMIREDLTVIKDSLDDYRDSGSLNTCSECSYAKSLGLGFTTCPQHAPELQSIMKIEFPL